MVIGRKECAAQRRHSDAEYNDDCHVRLQPDSECSDHVGLLNAGAHNAPKGGLVQ